MAGSTASRRVDAGAPKSWRALSMPDSCDVLVAAPLRGPTVSQIPTHPVSKLCATNLKIVRQMARQALESHKFRLSDSVFDGKTVI